jgi:NAD/NADP transhydrogenase beta subunit
MTVSRPVRRAVLFSAPLLMYVVGLIHPDKLVVGESDRLFLTIHLAFPFLICLLAWTLVLLVDGVDSRAATAARLLVIPFAVAYTAFESVAGIARGAFVWKAGELAVELQPTAAQLISSVSDSGLARQLWLTASALWLAAVLSVVLALRRRAPFPALVLLTVGALLFGWTHVHPLGPAGMAAFLAGVVWFELRPRHVVDLAEAHELPPEARSAG